MSVAICSSATGRYGRKVVPCFACKARRRHVVEDHGWYGAAWTCCACGAIDGRRDRRSAERAKKARARYVTALPWDKWLDAVVEAAREGR